MDLENHYDAPAAATDQKDNDNDDAVRYTTQLFQKLSLADVIVHPLVLLSVADHYHRVARGTRKRVIGLLLGQSLPGGTMDITNSFALPFEEDSKNPVRCFLVVVVAVVVMADSVIAELTNFIYMFIRSHVLYPLSC